MNELFRVHKLSEEGIALARDIANAFSDLDQLISGYAGREAESRRALALARTKLEEACFFAKKAMAAAHSVGD